MKKIVLKDLLIDTALSFSANFSQLLQLSLPLLLIISFADYFSVQSDQQTNLFAYLWWIISLITFCLLSSALIMFLSQVEYGQTISAKDSIISSIVYVPSIFFIYLLTFCFLIAMVKFMNLAGQSPLSALFFPTVIALVYAILKSSFAIYFIVLEDLTPLKAIIKSFRYTKGYISSIIVASFCFAIPIAIAQIFYKLLIKSLAVFNPLLSIGGEVFFSFLFILLHICIFKIFCISFSHYPGEPTAKDLS